VCKETLLSKRGMDTLRPHWSESQRDLLLQLVVHHRDVDTWRDTQGPDSASSNFWAGCLFCDTAKVAIISREDLAKFGCEINMRIYKIYKKFNIFLYFGLPCFEPRIRNLAIFF
jgi:hypothetical protein